MIKYRKAIETFAILIPPLLGLVVVWRAWAAISEPRSSFGPWNVGAEFLQRVFSTEYLRELRDAGYDVEMIAPKDSAGLGSVVGDTGRLEAKSHITSLGLLRRPRSVRYM
jgi:hypothetical protein